MGKKHKTERDRSRSPVRKKKKHRGEDNSPRHHESSHQNGDHSRKKHKHRSPHSDEDVPRQRSQSPQPQQSRRHQSGSRSPPTRRQPPPSSLSPEDRRGGGAGGRDGDAGGRQRGRDEASAAGGRQENRGRDEGWGRKSDSRDKGGERRGGAAGVSGVKKEEPAPEKEKANLGLSGKLTEDTNTFRGVVIKYNEPPEARKPKVKWRLYQFKGEEALPTLFVHRQSAYLIGRDRLIADIPVDHPSCSKQHAVLQYRLSEYTRDDGSRGKRVVPYIIDLGATNKTYLNNKPIDAQRYHELREKDVLKFGYSSREYVLLNDKSADSDEDDEGAP